VDAAIDDDPEARSHGGGGLMADNQQLRLTLRLQVADGEDFMEVRSGWPGAEIVMEHRLSGSALMQIVGDLRCAHENLAHECPACAQMHE
jgi:hypothetical protein